MSLQTIPQEILEEIAIYLPASGTSSLSSTCRLLCHRLTHALHTHAIAPYENIPALHWAISRHYEHLTRYLLRYFPATLPLPNGRTPLHTAALHLAPPVFTTLLVEHGADINAPDNSFRTPLFILCRHAQCTSAQMQHLLDLGANVNVTDVRHHSMLAHVLRPSVQRDDLAMTLLAAGADADIFVAGVKTALMIAAGNGNVELLAALIAGGADLNHSAFHGGTALCQAVGNGYGECAMLLLEAGADLSGLEVVGGELVLLGSR